MIYYLDTSALVKRYYTEKGSAWIQTLFHPEHLLIVSKVAYAELLAALARKRRDGEIGETDFSRAIESFQAEWKEFVVVEVTDAIFADLLSMVKRYPLRGFDAIHLCTALWFRRQVKSAVAFVCSDHNLLLVAETEKFNICDPAGQEEQEKL